MAIFGKDHSKDIKYLNEEREKTWARLTKLEKLVDEKPSDLEKEIKQASKKAAEYRNKTEKRLNEAIEILEEIKKKESKILLLSEEISSVKEQIEGHLETSIDSSDSIANRSSELLTNIEKITSTLEKHPNLTNEVDELESTMESLVENASKANTTYKGILSKKTEIDELHRTIIGYEDEDEEGETVKVEGLKSELETTYNSLSKELEDWEAKLQVSMDSSQNELDKFTDTYKDQLEKTKNDSKSEYDTITKKIETLLPTAMTAGLSSAFVAKRNEEEKIYEEYKTKFNRGIILLSLVSLLPIAISIFFLATGVSLSEVISRSPKVIFAFIPLYIPLVWTTISANKKVNLSKRLIEEYSHKQVLSMTIEGLSNQIENIEDSAVSKELRTQLLRSFLLVTSENPGKLISNYQKSDNPILNIFDRDKAKKEESKEEKSITKTVNERAKNLVEKTADEVENGVVNTVKNIIN